MGDYRQNLQTEAPNAAEPIFESDEDRLRVLSGLLESEGTMVLITDAERRTQWANPAFWRFTGFAEADLLGKNPGEVLQGEHPDLELKARMTAALDREEAFECEILNFTKDHSPYWTQLDIQPIHDVNGVLTRFVSIQYDITARKQSEERLRESEELYRKMISNISDVIVIIDREGINRYKSDTLEKVFGWKPEEVIGESALDHVHPDDCQKARELLEQIMASPGASGETECRYRSKDGSYRWIRFSGTNLLDDPRIQGVLGNYHDITARKEAERELILAKEQADAANQTKSQFLANMSHEIRTPMNGVLGIAELLGLTDLDETQQSYVKTIMDSGESLLGIIQDILDFSKIDAGKIELQEDETDLRALATKLTDLLRPVAKKKGLDLQLKLDPSLEEKVWVDADKLRQILINLLGNALKFTKQGSVRLQIDAEKGPGKQLDLRCVVSDTGIGINEEGRSKLFQAFSQVDSSNTRQYGGTGLGLVISDRLVQLMGGQIELVSTPGEGSEFFFTIRAETVRQTTSVPDSENGPREAILRYPPGVKILIAEDVEVNMTVVKEMLVRLLPEPELILARNGQEAIDLYREQQPDLILMDIQMPVLDGNLASEQIRRLEREQSMPRTPIVGLTARSMPHEIEAAMTHGMDQCLTKPVPLRSLGGVLEQYLQVNDS